MRNNQNLSIIFQESVLCRDIRIEIKIRRKKIVQSQTEKDLEEIKLKKSRIQETYTHFSCCLSYS